MVTIDPSGSCRSSLAPVVSSLPSGSQSMEYPIGWLAGSRVSMTSAVPSMSTATTCRSIQLQNHSRPSCHRGHSGVPSPLSTISGSGMTLLSSALYTNGHEPDRQRHGHLQAVGLGDDDV